MNGHDATTLKSLAWDYLCQKSHVVLLQVALDGTVLFANSFATRLTGLPLKGTPLASMLVFSSPDSPLPWLEPSSEPRLMNIRVADGLPQTLYITTECCDDTRLLFGQVDPEEQKRLHREVLELNHELTAMGRELAQTNVELDELNKLKNQFLGMASHDLRKPAGLILNYGELLLEEAKFAPGSTAEMMLRRMLASASAMTGLIDDFLDVTMIEAGRFNLDIEASDLQTLVSEALMLVEAAAKKRNVQLQVAIDPALPMLRVDRKKLEQVFTNLVSNAIEHSPEQGRVEIVCDRLEQGVTCRITDQGAGLSDEQRLRLFKAFRGGDKVKSSGERSIGLGLVIVRKIVEAHGGTVHVESEPGQGSCFSFNLPADCLSMARKALPSHTK